MARDGSLNAEGVTLCVEPFDRVWVAEAGVGSERSAPGAWQTATE
jgi:hypothetical protein